MQNNPNIQRGNVSDLALWRKQSEQTDKALAFVTDSDESIIVEFQLTDDEQGFFQRGDRIYCTRTNNLLHGETGLVLTPYGYMVRRYYMMPEGFVMLRSLLNSPDLCLHPSEVEIVGRAYQLVRSLNGPESEAA
ncbi:MAG TPA: hypothetical protein VF735_08820 [Pyrinomonadaceae bacterium]|jgi:hypothetical protein